MSGLKGVLKDGWHPKGKDGGKESWRGDFKGINQVAGWVGKGKNSNASVGPTRVSRPLSSLNDPSSFGPPPTRVGTSTAGRSSSNGLGAVLPVTSTREQRQEQVDEEQHYEYENSDADKPKPAAPPLPYRADTTGLSTSHLPPPPARRGDGSDFATGTTIEPRVAAKPKPSLPPRLPSRAGSDTNPPPYSAAREGNANSPEPTLGSRVTNRLANAGVSVPGLGITRSNSNGDEHKGESRPVSELQARFARMRTSDSASSTPTYPPSQLSATTPRSEGTTLEEKQAALKTMQDFHRDPSSVSAKDAKIAASTANNFKERHNDTIQTGMKKLNGFNQKYGITKKINNFIEDQKSPAYPNPQQPQHLQQQQSLPGTPSQVSPVQNVSRPDLEALNKRKPPPPPPPPKKLSLQAAPVSDIGSNSSSPPPLPLGTKPR